MCTGYCDTIGLLKDKLSDSAFISSGFNNWSCSGLSSMHNLMLTKNHYSEQLMEQPTILSQLNTQLKNDQAAQRDLLVITLTSLQYLILVRQGLPIRGHEETEGNSTQLLLLRASDCCGLKQYVDNGNSVT